MQEIGAIAGVAAAVGLPLLAALHVTHARDVKWLRERAGWAPRRSRPARTSRRVAIAVVGLLALGGAARLAGDDGRDRSGPAPAKSTPKRKRPAVKPANVTVAVLNGTTVPGLAAALREEIAAAGFKKGVIDVFSDQQRTESVVQYAPGRQAEAKAVGRSLGITRREPVSADSRALAPDATVIVIAGADKAP